MDDYPLMNLFLTMLYLFLWVMWFFLLFKVVTDVFRDHSMKGWAKAGWLVFVIVLPYLGVLVYLIARGPSMAQRDAKQAKEREAAFRQYVREVAGPESGDTGRSTGHVSDLEKLAELKDRGHINQAEYEQVKAKILV